MTQPLEDRDALDGARTRFTLAQASYKSARIAAQEAADEQTIAFAELENAAAEVGRLSKLYLQDRLVTP